MHVETSTDADYGCSITATSCCVREKPLGIRFRIRLNFVLFVLTDVLYAVLMKKQRANVCLQT